MDRYFIVVYLASFDRGTSTGSNTFTVSGGGFINSNEVCEQIKERNESMNFQTVIVTNIIELDKKDFERWIL